MNQQSTGGTEWNCARCGKRSSLQGHFTSLHFTDNGVVRVEFHACCPDDCELDEHPMMKKTPIEQMDVWAEQMRNGQKPN